MNLEIYSDTDFDVKHNEIQTKNSGKIRQSQPAKLRFAEQRVEKQLGNAIKESKKKEEKNNNKSGLSKTTTTLERDHILNERTSTSQIFSDKDIGDSTKILLLIISKERMESP